MKKITPSLLIRLILMMFFTGILIYLSVEYVPEITRLASKPEEFRKFVLSYGTESVFIFIGFQILQVIITAIPGELIQVAGGYIYGVWLGTLYSLAGIILGSTFVFFFARVLGYPILKAIIPAPKIERFSFLINSPKAEIIIFILLLIPGAPKDILSYLAGITPMQPVRFIMISAIARFPGIIISSYIGASIVQNQFGKVAIAIIIALLFSLTGLFYKDKIINHFKSHR